jgi:hypothetical protein
MLTSQPYLWIRLRNGIADNVDEALLPTSPRTEHRVERRSHHAAGEPEEVEAAEGAGPEALSPRT